MKILPVVVFFLVSFFFTQFCFGQDTDIHDPPVPDSVMQDTSIAIDPAFVVRNVYATKDSLAKIRAMASLMQDTTIVLDPSFVVVNVYAEKDLLDANGGVRLTRRELLIKAIRDSLNAIGSSLMRAAEMQDTIIALDPAFIVREIYAQKDSLRAIRDSVRSLYVQAAQMQDTTIELDPSFMVLEVYAKKDSLKAISDSARALIVQASQMQDTTIELDPSFAVLDVYAKKDSLEAIQLILDKPGTMQDTVILLDPDFIVRDLYPLKDSLQFIKDSLTARTDSLYADSLHRHWAGWKKYEVQPSHSYTLNSQKVLKGRSKTVLQYNIADFYLYLNGELVRPPKSGDDFFAAGCLAFIYEDTILLNSGLGVKLGVGVGIKIFQERFTSSLHANTRNEEIYKISEDDSIYLKNIIAEPTSQSLKLRSDPAYGSDIIIGEYQAAYKKFYQKNEDGQDEERRYTVKIIFRCRVNGGITNRLR